MTYKMKEIIVFFMIYMLVACQTMSDREASQELEIAPENEITKDVRLFANQMAKRIYQITPDDARVLIMDFTDLGKEFTYLGTYISDKLSEELVQNENIKLINRANIEMIIGELSFQQSGMVTVEDILKIGEFSGANILINGTITDLGDEIDVSAEITYLATSEIIPASYRMIKTKDNMALISAITVVEREKEEELQEMIQRLEAEIEQRKNELEHLVNEGAAEVAEKLKEEEIKMRRELDEFYQSRLEQIEQQLREKSTLLAKLREKEKELRWYETEIGKIQQKISKQNEAVKYYITTGMTGEDVKRILGISRISITYGPTWGKHFNESRFISFHGDYVIVWSDPGGIVLGYCNRITGNCYRRSAGD